MDKRIAEATRVGEKNVRTITLIKNWCAHARIESMSGGGLVAQMTGLPIGHQSMACDYAVAGSVMSSWDLEMAALDFHDRYCVGCTYRKPVRLPNLSALVSARDQEREAASQREAAARREQEAAHRERRAVRAALRAKSPPLAKTLVDQLDRLDADPSDRTAAEFAAAAELAPEAFTPDLIGYLFSLVEGQDRWATEAAMVALDNVGASPKRLANGALRSLARYGGIQSAEVLLRHLDHASPALVGPAVSMLIHHARPDRLPAISDREVCEPKYLIAVHHAFPQEVERKVSEFLEMKDRWRLSDGARAVCVLGAEDGGIAMRFSRTIISKLIRSTWLSEEVDTGEVYGDLREAAALAFAADPVATEDLIEKFRIGASGATQKQLTMIYQWVLRRRSFGGRTTPLDAGERAAFDRMVTLASNPPDEEIAQELASFFTHSVFGYEALAGDKIDALLGAAALMVEPLARLDARHAASPAVNFLERLERRNHRSALTSLQNGLIELAAKAAAGDSKRTRQYLDLLAELPAEHAELRCHFIEQLDELVTSPATFGEVLPPLYGALVGASTLERSAAARALGKMSSRQLQNAPPLLLEAFVALLNDPFLLPVAEVIEALERVRVSEQFRAPIRAKLIVIALSYANNVEHQRFLVQTINTLASHFLTPEERNGRIGALLIGMLEPVERHHYSQDLHALGYRFRDQPAFGRLIAICLQDPSFRQHDSNIDHLRRLGAASIGANIQAFEDLIPSLDLSSRDWVVALVLIESFTRAGLWDGALRILDTMEAALPEVPNTRLRRLQVSALQTATRIERAVAATAFTEVPGLKARWREATEQMAEERQRGDAR